LINKILFTIFVVVAIWKAFSFISKLSRERGASPVKAEPPGKPEAGQRSIELVPCRRCGAYIDPKEGCRCSA
jgi:hypothetical protein